MSVCNTSNLSPRRVWLSDFYRVPIQTSFGRRPVLIASTIICVVSNIWRAVATDYSSFMGACILNGIGAGPAEVVTFHPVPRHFLNIILHRRPSQPLLLTSCFFTSEVHTTHYTLQSILAV